MTAPKPDVQELAREAMEYTKALEAERRAAESQVAALREEVENSRKVFRSASENLVALGEECNRIAGERDALKAALEDLVSAIDEQPAVRLSLEIQLPAARAALKGAGHAL